jgi:Zn-dependent protease with chaperone function
MGQKLSNSLFDELAHLDTAKPGFSTSKGLAYLVASLVHGFTLGLFLLGCFLLIWCWPAILVEIIGLFLILLAWYVRPKMTKMGSVGKITRSAFPALYEMTDKVTQALNTSKVEAIFIDTSFNASISQVGWRRKKKLTLGLPLFSTLTDDERLALLGHEIGHCVNGDPNRNLFIGSAIASLVAWYPLLQPAPSRFYKPGLLVMLTRPILNLLLRTLAQVVKLLVKLLSNLNWRDSQRAEYLADALAARIGGSSAMLSMLEKLHYHDSFNLALHKVALSKNKLDLFEEYQSYLKEVPERELDRIRRIEQLSASRLDSTHPPTGYRVAVIKNKPVLEPQVIWSSEKARLVEQELKRFHKSVQEILVDRYQNDLY